MVNAYLDSYTGTKAPVINTLYVYDDHNGNSYIVYVNQYLYFKYKKVALLSTFQARSRGTEVHNSPKQFDPKPPFSKTFSNQAL